MRRRASAQGTVATDPSCNSAARLAISNAQAASASSSILSSRLSSRDPASAARPSGGSLSASLSSSLVSSVMCSPFVSPYKPNAPPASPRRPVSRSPSLLDSALLWTSREGHPAEQPATYQYTWVGLEVNAPVILIAPPGAMPVPASKPGKFTVPWPRS